jgi:uncharacterized protein with FMN-binding domain
MKQIALSLFVIASSGAYVWDQAGKAPAGDMIDTAGPARAAEDNVLQPVGQLPAPAAAAAPPAQPSFAIEGQSVRIKTPAPPPITVVSETLVAPAAPAEWTPPGLITTAAPATIKTPAYIPIPKLKPSHRKAPARVIKTSMKSSVTSTATLAANGFADGAYTGPVTDAYYGLIQIQALIRGGRLVALKVLRYPSDRRTSIAINRQALPLLRDEAISAQSANVDIISGATLTSRAFVQSLGGALKKAAS